MNRDYRYTIRLNEEEYKKILEKYKKSKYYTLSEFIRHLILRKEVIVIDFDFLIDRNYQISKIGNNINQIARIANSTSDFFYDDFVELKKEFSKVIEENKKINTILSKKIEMED